MLDAYKELTPVVYGEKAIKLLYCAGNTPGTLLFSMHWHERMELLVVIDGSLELYTEEGRYIVRSGQVAVTGPRQMHGGFVGDEGVKYYTVMFDVEKFCNGTIASERYLAPICEKQIRFRRVIEDERLFKTMLELVEELEGSAEKSPLPAIGDIYKIIGILYQYREETAGNVLTPDKGFGTVLEYVNAHYTEKISAGDISDRFGYNEAYFCRRFKEITGINYSRYIQALRMEYAQKLLRNTTDEIGTVAWKCGYTDISYFSNCFKKHTGYSPTQFRLL